MSFLSKVWFVTGSASGLRRSIAEVRLLNLMAIVVTFSIPVIYTFAADTPLLLEPHNLIVDHSLPREEADTQIIAARRCDEESNRLPVRQRRACSRCDGSAAQSKTG